MNINDELIKKFRETVNKNSGFVYETYHDQNGKNLWNIICSCMDWISVSVRFLSENIELDKNIDVRVMQFFSIISAIDIVFEGITQLHRTIFKNNNIPFSGQSIVFDGNYLKLDDNKYFKEVRAMFGAHPVNLNNNDEKWYASWPYDQYTSSDSTFELRIYSNKVNVKDRTIGIKIENLEKFLIIRYEYLNVLEKELHKQYINYCNELVSKEIVLTGQELDDLKILKLESSRRLNNDYYNGIISELIKLFSITLVAEEEKEELKNEEIEYKIKLKLLIDELTRKLQMMEFEELKYEHLLNPDYSYENLGYSISKLYNYDFDRRREPLFDYHMKTLDDFSRNRYGFLKTKDPKIIFLKMKMMLYNSYGKN